MWIDVGQLIREHVPDKNGKTLPADLTTGSYEFRDLTNTGVGALFEGKVVYDKSYGHVAYGCAACCGWSIPVGFWYDPLGIPVDNETDQGVFAADQCNSGDLEDVSDSFYNNWSTGNTSIATVDSYGTHSGVSVGSTRSFTHGLLNNNNPIRYCPLTGFEPSGGDCVIQLMLQGNQYNSLFVGSDPNLAAANSIFATVSPSGGTFTTTSSASGDTFTPVTTGGPGWVVGTTTQSANLRDRTITVTYAVSGQGSVSQSLSVTARQFAYATNNTPSNTCTLGYGTAYLYAYTPYTHPDGTAVQAGIGLTNTAVTESFNPQPPAGTVTGSGSLDANSQFYDKLVYCSSSPLSSYPTVTQTISIEGYQVRQNSLTYSSAGVGLTSNGPTQ
ncbi:MAG TPA: hypothetical protein VJW51_07865 [Candidatus Acidoferrales bacterium]|nr:hypothetical protein [Candidatus Acidoferrales bacterium]